MATLLARAHGAEKLVEKLERARRLHCAPGRPRVIVAPPCAPPKSATTTRSPRLRPIRG